MLVLLVKGRILLVVVVVKGRIVIVLLYLRDAVRDGDQGSSQFA